MGALFFHRESPCLLEHQFESGSWPGLCAWTVLGLDTKDAGPSMLGQHSEPSEWGGGRDSSTISCLCSAAGRCKQAVRARALMDGEGCHLAESIFLES